MTLTFLISDDPLQQRIILSELRVLTALYCGWHSPVKQALDRAIDDPTQIENALEVVDALPGRPRRQILASLGALTCEGWPTPKGGRELSEDGGEGESCPLCGRWRRHERVVAAQQADCGKLFITPKMI